MEDDALETITKIKSVLTERPKVGEAVFEYLALNEYDTVYMIQSALSTKSECIILDEMQRKFRLKAYETDWLFGRMYEAVFGYKPQDPDSEDEESDDDTKQQLDADSNGFELITPQQLDWNQTQYALSKFKDHLKRHNEPLHLGTHYGEAGRALLQILAVGHPHGINVLRLIFDIFNEYRLYRYILSKHQEHLNMRQFMDRCPYFKSLDVKLQKLWYSATDYYSRKYSHVILFNAMCVVNDSYRQFVQYMFAMTQCLDKLREPFVDGSGCPFQVDFWIIPRHAVRVDTRADVYGNGDALFDYIEDDEDDEQFDELNCPETVEEDADIGDVEERLHSVKMNYIKEVIGHNEHRHVVAAKMLNAIKFVTNNEYHHKRVIVIVDRRVSVHRKWSKTSDIMYVFRPDRYGTILGDRYGFDTMNALSRSYLLPKVSADTTRGDISVTDDLRARMWMTSFHIYSWRRIQTYWYFQSGGCTRFRPEFLYKLWPLYFVKDLNADAFKEIDKKTVDKEWKIPSKDELFEAWYPIVTGNGPPK